MENQLTVKQTELLFGNKIKVTTTGLIFKEKITKEEWLHTGNILQYIQGSIHFWLGDWTKYGEEHFGEDYSQGIFGYNSETIRGDIYTCERIEPVRRRTNLPYSYHREVAPLEPKQQDELLNKAEEEGWKRNELRAEVKKIKQQSIKTPELPEGKYNILYCDPPWQFNNSGFSESAESHYQTMSTDEICLMPIQKLCYPETVLFMWATNAMLEDALKVIKEWGFTYKSNFVWIKDKGPSIGWFTQSRHELLLIATKDGNLHPQVKLNSWFKAPVTKHSKKPEIVYDFIEQIYKGPYCELFAREKRNKWKVWGNEISKDKNTENYA